MNRRVFVLGATAAGAIAVTPVLAVHREPVDGIPVAIYLPELDGKRYVVPGDQGPGSQTCSMVVDEVFGRRYTWRAVERFRYHTHSVVRFERGEYLGPA